MIRKEYAKPGDIYEIILKDGRRKRYIQFVARDKTNLNSDVLRIFKSYYDMSDSPSIETIVSDAVDFYLHTSAKVGIQLGSWRKIGTSSEIGALNIRFKLCLDLDYDDKQVFTSDNWVIWTINEEWLFVGKLPQDYYHLDDGKVFSPAIIVDSCQ